MSDHDHITIRVQDTPSGRLLARSLEIMRERNVTMGEAMDLARAELEAAR